MSRSTRFVFALLIAATTGAVTKELLIRRELARLQPPWRPSALAQLLAGPLNPASPIPPPPPPPGPHEGNTFV